MTWRELRVLLTELPHGSRLAVAEHGDLGGWSRQDYMIADVIDSLQVLAYLTQAQASKKKPPLPKPYPRPNTDRAKLLADRLDKWRDRHAGGGDGD